MMGNSDEYVISKRDFYSQRYFDSAAYTLDINTSLLFNKNNLLCLKFEMGSNCGTSISDHSQYSYINIDLTTISLITFDSFFDALQTQKLQLAIKKIAKKNKVDNVAYNGLHDQNKINYLDSLERVFYISDTTIGFFTLVFDNNEIDWQRRAKQEGAVGEEFMRIDVSKIIISKFISRKFRNRIQ